MSLATLEPEKSKGRSVQQARRQETSQDHFNDDGRSEIRNGVFGILLFFGVFIGWAAFAPLDAAVVAPGVVVVSGNRQTVQHRDGGVVSRLAVHEGQAVKQNEILIELGAPELVAQERALFSQIVDLQMQRERLAAETQGAQTLERPPEWAAFSPEDQAVADAAYQRHQSETQSGAWSEYDARIFGYRQESAAVSRQEALLGEELEGMRRLAERQFAPMTRVRTLERAMAELQARRAELSASVAAAQQERFAKLRDVEGKLAELTPQLIGAREQLERTRLRAPVDGLVVGLQVHNVGAVIQPGERVLDIVPQDKDLIIEAQVRPEDADDVNPGQNTEVRITAFSGRNLPIVHGAIRYISADRFTEQNTGRGYFLAQVAVPEEQIKALTDRAGRSLRAGLPAQIVIPTRKRTALSYLIEPLNQALWRSFREQ